MMVNSGAYHEGLNFLYNVAEPVNFATSEWLSWIAIYQNNIKWYKIEDAVNWVVKRGNGRKILYCLKALQHKKAL